MSLFAQVRRTTPPRRPAPPPPVEAKKEPPPITCPTPLGPGLTSGLEYCDILTGTDPAGGVLIPLPPHDGPVTLTFNLHNRHTYSEELVQKKRAYAKYTATIGVMAMDNTLISRAIVQSEFRTSADLVERIGGGAGPGGVKAVAPTGTEAVTIEIPEIEEQVSLLGEKLTVQLVDGSNPTFLSAGRPVAIVSNVMIEYRPPPPPKPVRPATRKPAR